MHSAEDLRSGINVHHIENVLRWNKLRVYWSFLSIRGDIVVIETSRHRDISR